VKPDVGQILWSIVDKKRRARGGGVYLIIKSITLFKMKNLLYLSILSCFLGGCIRDNEFGLLESMVDANDNCEISECTYQNQKYYTQTSNYYDSPTMIYDEDGAMVGACNNAWSEDDELCYLLQSCRVIYRCEDHISGEPAVNVYDL
jgi:hypothetical protein